MMVLACPGLVASYQQLLVGEAVKAVVVGLLDKVVALLDRVVAVLDRVVTMLGDLEFSGLVAFWQQLLVGEAV